MVLTFAEVQTGSFSDKEQIIGVTKRESEREENQPTDSNFFSTERAPLLVEASEFTWLTCVFSALNGEEFVRDGGVPLLANSSISMYL
jgi:hypothetical protein